MRDIISKQITLRTAKAIGIIFCTPETIQLIKADALPKGNLFDVARAAGFIGAKLTPQLLPHCHPVQIDGMDMSFEFLDRGTHAQYFDEAVFNSSGIVVLGNAKSIGRTGIEMEMLTAVSVACLEIYDMLKPVDKQLEIGHIKLLQKRGGKSDRERFTATSPICAVLVCSDSTAAGMREDKSGKLAMEMLKEANATIVDYQIVPDDNQEIQEQIKRWVADDVEFIFTTGGTGLGPRDNTAAAVKAILEHEAEGIAEAMRVYGQQRTPLAMMSQGIAGTIAQTLIITLPGSTGGVKESLEAILPGVFHARKMMLGEGH